ncbi:MAG: hypothetical protein R3C28_04075 [Pirellulaceae bacterium]
MDTIVQRINDRMLIHVRDKRDGEEDKATAFSLGAKKFERRMLSSTATDRQASLSVLALAVHCGSKIMKIRTR